MKTRLMKYINGLASIRERRAHENAWREFAKIGGYAFDKSVTKPTAAGSGLSPLIWGDCPRANMWADPLVGHFIGDDFANAGAKSFTTAYDYTLAGANGAFTHVASDPNGVALLNAPGTDNDECNVNRALGVGAVSLTAAASWWFEARVKMNQIATAQGVFVGLVDDQVTMGVDFMTDNTMALKLQGLIGFQVIAATDIAAIWQTIHAKASGAQVALNATAATASTSWVKLGMKCVTGTVSFFVDGVQDATTVASTATNFPLNLYAVPGFATKCGSAAANTLSIDWWYAAQLR